VPSRTPEKLRPRAAGASRRPSPPRRRRPPRRALLFGIPLAGIVAVCAIAIGIHLSTGSSTPSTPDASDLQFVSNAKAEFAGIPSKGDTVGYASAPVTIEEFGDLRCPICREFDASVMPDVLQNLVRTRKAKIVYRHWPILGPNSVYANRAAYAAERQNRLWEYALVTYYNQGDENYDWFTKSFADLVAQAIGLDQTRFDADFDDTSAASAEAASVEQTAVGRHFQGTPSVLVIGPKKTADLSGTTPTYDDIAKAVGQVAP
jgi:protein-disulfide isomerase